MPHLLVQQLRFTRLELVRVLDNLPPEDAVKRLTPMNAISWMVGHLANQEQYYWLYMAQQKLVEPDLYHVLGQPASTPPLDEMLKVWERITAESNAYLDTLTPASLQNHLEEDGQPRAENIGTSINRVIYHYWYHIGEIKSIRQILGHPNLPEFVGALGKHAPYQPE